MKIYILAVSLVLLIKPSKQKEVAPRITGGTPAEPGQFPWQVAVMVKKIENEAAICGGALISDKWVLTAAQCALRAREFTLHFGGLTLFELEFGKTVMVSKCSVIHPDFDNRTLKNDIALIGLPRQIMTYWKIRPIALPSALKDIGPDVTVTVSGWEKTSDSFYGYKNIEKLYYGHLKTIGNFKCNQAYHYTITSSTLCAVGGPQRISCTGDTGGPLVYYDNEDNSTILVGVFSFVSKEGCKYGSPYGFARVASFRNWINEYTGL